MWLKYASRVVAVAHLLDGEVEDRRVEPLSADAGRQRRSRAPLASASRQAWSAASATSSCASARLARREPPLELGAGPGERPREPPLGVAAHPAEDLDRGAERAERSDEPRRVPVARRRELGARRRRAPLPASAGRRGGSRNARAPWRRARPSRTCRSRRAPRRGTTSAPRLGGRRAPGTSDAIRTAASRGTTGSDERRARLAPVVPATSADGDRGALERHARLGQRALHDGEDGERLGEPQRAL